MIFLTPIFTESDIENSKEVFGAMSEAERQRNLSGMRKMATISLSDNPSLTVSKAEDENGNLYENVEIRINTRFKKNGNLYLANASFAVNYSALLETLDRLA